VPAPAAPERPSTTDESDEKEDPTVLETITHRSAGTGGVLAAPGDRSELVRFLKSIDAVTPPFP
jgi:hypothetical protein